MTYISLLNKTSDLVELLESNLTVPEIVKQIVCNEQLEMKDIDKANKEIVKKYGKNNVTTHKFPADPRCEYACTAHNHCLCLYIYLRPTGTYYGNPEILL